MTEEAAENLSQRMKVKYPNLSQVILPAETTVENAAEILNRMA